MVGDGGFKIEGGGVGEYVTLSQIIKLDLSQLPWASNIAEAQDYVGMTFEKFLVFFVCSLVQIVGVCKFISDLGGVIPI